MGSKQLKGFGLFARGIWGISMEYGEIFVATGTVSQNMDTGWTKVNQFVANGVSTSQIIPDHTNDQVTVNKAGDYFVILATSFSGANNADFEAHLFVNGEEIPHIGFHRKLSASGDIGSAAGMGIATCAVGDVIDMYVRSDGGANAFLMEHGNLSLFLLK